MAWFYLSDGVPLWYEDRGTGPAILLVPGWTYTTRFYDQQINDLSVDHRVIAVDLRGAGNSGKTRSGHSLSQYAADLLELVTYLELRDVTVVAWAMAVSVSLHALSRDQSRFAGLVWVDHSPRFFTANDWPYALNGDLDPWMWDEQIQALQRDRPTETRSLLVSCFNVAPSTDDLDWMTAELLKTPTEVMAHMLATVANVDVRPMLPHVSVPVLLINGRHSIVPFAVGEWVSQQIPKARKVVFDLSGHLPYLEEPERFNREVRTFVKEVCIRR
jgi:non-heme chloroperoxidase